MMGSVASSTSLDGSNRLMKPPPVTPSSSTERMPTGIRKMAAIGTNLLKRAR